MNAISDNSCDQHTYVNTLDMDFSRNCSKLSYSTPMESNQPNASILKSDTAAFQSIVASNGDDDIGNAKSSTTDSVCLNGIVEKKLSIFERIKLLNNDATARGVTSKDYNIPEIRFKQEPESAVKFREKSNDGTSSERFVVIGRHFKGVVFCPTFRNVPKTICIQTEARSTSSSKFQRHS